MEAAASNDWVESIEPPLPPTRHASGIPLPTNPALCPICGETRRRSATCTSGILFCFDCLKNFVEEHGFCPVTRYPSSIADIRRVYDI